MRISVCMGVYNGEKYIKEQLESIRLFCITKRILDIRKTFIM